jgi:citrate lyase beta subunit
VPPEESEKARDLVSENLITVHDRCQRVVERINGHPNDPDKFTHEDVEEVICEELDAIFVPKAQAGRGRRTNR